VLKEMQKDVVDKAAAVDKVDKELSLNMVQ